ERLSGEQLEERQPAAIECVRRPGEIDTPDAILFVAYFGTRDLGIGFEPIAPLPQRLRVMLAQRLGVDQLESLARQTLDDDGHMRELSARKHVFLDEVAD